MICRRRNLRVPSKSTSFAGHLVLDKFKFQMQREEMVTRIPFRTVPFRFSLSCFVSLLSSFHSSLICQVLTVCCFLIFLRGLLCREMQFQLHTVPSPIQSSTIWPCNGLSYEQSQIYGGRLYMRCLFKTLDSDTENIHIETLYQIK